MACGARPGTLALFGCEPSTLSVASVISGTLMAKASLVTERDIQNPPCGLMWRCGILGGAARLLQAFSRPRKLTPGLSLKPKPALSGGGGDEEQQLPEQLAGQQRDHRQIEQARGRHEGAKATGGEGWRGGQQREDHRA